MSLAERLAAAPSVQFVRRALQGAGQVWIVGGALRDAALGRAVSDLDLAVSGDPAAIARAIAAAGKGHAFELSADFGTWRATAADGTWQVDSSPLRGETIEVDLGRRDFTIGALALPLPGGEAIDPHGGLADLDRGLLRAVGADSFAADPLRLLRAARIAAELGLTIEPATVNLARAEAPRVKEAAGERQLVELGALIGGPEPLRGLALLDELQIIEFVLPEVAALRGVRQGPNHHLDVYGHTLEVLAHTLEVESDLPRFAGDRAAQVGELLAEPLADQFTRATALRFGALLHDVGKPPTRTERAGNVTFIGHDRDGAEIVAILCSRLHASRRLTQHLRALTLHHLRLGFLVHEAPLPRRRVYEYLRATDPVGADVTLLTVADRLAARGSGALATQGAIEAHLALAREMLAAALDWRRDGPPTPLLRGNELAEELGIQEGPELGQLLAQLAAAQYCGAVRNRTEAVAYARGLNG